VVELPVVAGGWLDASVLGAWRFTDGVARGQGPAGRDLARVGGVVASEGFDGQEDGGALIGGQGHFETADTKEFFGLSQVSVCARIRVNAWDGTALGIVDKYPWDGDLATNSWGLVLKDGS